MDELVGKVFIQYNEYRENSVYCAYCYVTTKVVNMPSNYYMNSCYLTPSSGIVDNRDFGFTDCWIGLTHGFDETLTLSDALERYPMLKNSRIIPLKDLIKVQRDNV